MKRVHAGLLALLLVTSPIAFAGGDRSGSEEVRSGSSGAQVPELDAGAAGLALGLVVTASALMRERRRQK